MKRSSMMVKKNPKYSFVMPAYKRQFLRESIGSILSQQYEDFELIIVDDASPYDLQEIVSDFSDSRIRYYRNGRNIGSQNLVQQWNKSLSYARGEWVILSTDDDVYERNFLSTADDLLRKYPHINLFRARVCGCDVHGNVYSVESCLSEIATLEELLFSMFNGLHGGIPQYVFRKSSLDNIGGLVTYPKAWGSDDYTALVLSSTGILFSSNVLLKFRMSNSNISSAHNYVEEKLLARFYYYANIYTKVLPLLDERNLYTSLIRLNYSRWVWKDLLMYFHLLPIYKRHIFFSCIMNMTPYLNQKEKYKLCIRAYIKKIQIKIL